MARIVPLPQVHHYCFRVVSQATNTLLCFRWNRLEALDWLLEKGADETIMDSEKVTPLIAAVRNNNTEAVFRLVNKSCDYGKPPLPFRISKRKQHLFVGSLKYTPVGRSEVVSSTRLNAQVQMRHRAERLCSRSRGPWRLGRVLKHANLVGLLASGKRYCIPYWPINNDLPT